MIEWDVTDEGIRAVDALKNELVVESPNWESTECDVAVDRPVDAEVQGTTDFLRIPQGNARLYDLKSGDTVDLVEEGGGSFDKSTYMVVFDASVKTYLKFAGAVEVDVAPDREAVTVSFTDRTSVAIGFRSNVRAPAANVTVPETLDGIAAAITYASCAHRTMTPDRTYWSMRRHPPTFEFGDELDVPEEVKSETPDTGIRVVVPESLRALFLTAPLAFYLGAEVDVVAGADPHIRIPERDYRFDLGTNLVKSAPDMLARVFWFDCIARNGGPYGNDRIIEHDVLPEVGIDHEEAYEASPAERLEMYLEAPYTLVKDDLPDWHLAMHVEPSMENVESLPFLLNRLSFIYPPETAELEGQELMERSLDDFYRQPPGPIATVEMLKPKLRRGRVHGWLADGTPIDVFKTLPQAYENHLSYLGQDDDDMSVVVVLNDRDMAGEHEAVADIYEERAEDMPMDVSLRYDLTCDELAELFAESHEFVHYIGHCEVDGLRCTDGNLAISNIPETNVQTFFLNACGSYYEGLDLVEKGAVAGAVTFRKVLDEQAAKVGTAFARLLIHGFPIETSLRLARRRIMMGKDYAVVGDGMQSFSQKENYQTDVAYMDTLESGELRVSWETYALGSHGGFYQVHAPSAGPPRLCGNEMEFTLRPDELVEFFQGEDLPVILDGEFYWTDEIVEKFG